MDQVELGQTGLEMMNASIFARTGHPWQAVLVWFGGCKIQGKYRSRTFSGEKTDVLPA